MTWVDGMYNRLPHSPPPDDKMKICEKIDTVALGSRGPKWTRLQSGPWVLQYLQNPAHVKDSNYLRKPISSPLLTRETISATAQVSLPKIQYILSMAGRTSSPFFFLFLFFLCFRSAAVLAAFSSSLWAMMILGPFFLYSCQLLFLAHMKNNS